MPTPTFDKPITRSAGDASDALFAESVTAAYGSHTVLQGVDLAVRNGSITGLIGPNGSGKSTLLRVLGRLIKPNQGKVSIHQTPIDRMPARKLARVLAVMPQHPIAPPGVTVEELVGYGRAPFNAWYKPAAAEDRDIVAAMIDRCDLTGLAQRLVHTLSGGERQRAWIAMALAQQPSVLLLDEPVSALDIGHQLEVMDLLTGINREEQTTVVVVLHDLNLAGRYCDELVALHDGRVVKAGRTEDVLDAATIRECFKVETEFHTGQGGRTLCSFSRTTP